ncbi:UNKNOWN [Stylonychia lemnae]|uniref:Uncharacterized protein n=1 Tax=Stylonychia lemnae TaxID=5949 RepID=A0A077ZVQ5_STYLE|nr:UNKNOWN [Stylonychia lemnae]|eukprot:CDW74020.1 UNKNOWN [Stylonychia lemnae]
MQNSYRQEENQTQNKNLSQVPPPFVMGYNPPHNQFMQPYYYGPPPQGIIQGQFPQSELKTQSDLNQIPQNYFQNQNYQENFLLNQKEDDQVDKTPIQFNSAQESYGYDQEYYQQSALPMETIFEHKDEHETSQILQKKRIKKKSSSKSRTRGQSETERKRMEADQFLRSIQTKQQDQVVDLQKQKIAKDLTSAMEMSQFSQFSDENFVNIKKYKVNQLPENIKLKDQEDILFDLNQLKQENNIQKDEIKLLKAEIVKLKKSGANQQKTSKNQNTFDPNLMEPYDLEKLKAELNSLKKELHQEKESNKILKASQEQYKKRAYYAKNKFYEAKEKFNKDQDPTNAESKYRLKNTELKNLIKKLEEGMDAQKDENNQLKLKLSQTIESNKFRDEYEKAQKLIKKQELKIQQLESEIEQNRYDMDMQRQIEIAMRKEDEINQSQSSDENDKLQSNYQQEQSEQNDTQNDLDSSSFSSKKFSNKNIQPKKQNVQTLTQIKDNIKTKDYVSATLMAWNNCPSIVKKQLDEQSKEIKELRMQIKEFELKLKLRKNDFDKVQGVEMKKDLMKHKEKIESIYRQKLEDEKRRILKMQMEEFEDLVKENKELKDELGKIKLILAKK